MRPRLLLLLCCLLPVLGLAACGADDKDGSQARTTATTPAQDTSTLPEEPEALRRLLPPSSVRAVTARVRSVPPPGSFPSIEMNHCSVARKMIGLWQRQQCGYECSIFS